MIDPKSRWFVAEQMGPALRTWCSIWEDEEEEDGDSQDHSNNTNDGSTGNTAQPALQSSSLGSSDCGSRATTSLNSTSTDSVNQFLRKSNQEYMATHHDLSSQFRPVKRSRQLGTNMASTYGYNTYRISQMLHTTSVCQPWIRPGVKYEQSLAGLDQELLDFFQYIKPTVFERAIRQELFSVLHALLKSSFSELVIETYGSFKTDLFLPTSDIDLVVLGDWKTLPLAEFKHCLLQSGLCFPDSLLILDRAAVPIIKFRSTQHNLRVDITFNTRHAIKTSQFIKQLLSNNPVIKILVMTLKQFLLQRDANEVYHGGISSYALLLMTASFIRQLPREECEGDKINLGLMLIKFFEFYGRTFDYSKYAISIKSPHGYVEKSALPALCKANASFHHGEAIAANALCIEDPLDSHNDIGRSSYGVAKIKSYFEAAYISLMQVVMPGIDFTSSEEKYCKSILGRVILITPEISEYRKAIKNAYECYGAQNYIGTMYATLPDPGRFQRMHPAHFDRGGKHGNVTPGARHSTSGYSNVHHSANNNNNANKAHTAMPKMAANSLPSKGAAPRHAPDANLTSTYRKMLGQHNSTVACESSQNALTNRFLSRRAHYLHQSGYPNGVALVHPGTLNRHHTNHHHLQHHLAKPNNPVQSNSTIQRAKTAPFETNQIQNSDMSVACTQQQQPSRALRSHPNNATVT